MSTAFTNRYVPLINIFGVPSQQSDTIHHFVKWLLLVRIPGASAAQLWHIGAHLMHIYRDFWSHLRRLWYTSGCIWAASGAHLQCILSPYAELLWRMCRAYVASDVPNQGASGAHLVRPGGHVVLP